MLTACGCTAEVDGVDMRPTSAAPYFCVKTEYKGANGDAPVKICRGGHGALNAPTCPGGEPACGRSGYPSPPPSPPYVSPPSTPPTCTTSDAPYQTTSDVKDALDTWCTGGKDATAKCAPSTWHVSMAAGQEINGVIAASACTMATYGDDPGDDMNGWDVR